MKLGLGMNRMRVLASAARSRALLLLAEAMGVQLVPPLREYCQEP